MLSVEDGPGGAWKPAASAYRYAAQECGTDPAEMLMVACHPWDLQGAAAAGLATAWVNRSGTSWPHAFTPPTYVVSGFEELAETLCGALARADHPCPCPRAACPKRRG